MKQVTKRLPWLYLVAIVYLSVLSVGQWSSLHLGNTTIQWILSFVIIFINFTYYRWARSNEERIGVWLLSIYMLWLAFNVARGALFYTEGNYWLWKQLISGTLSLLLPCYIYVFIHPPLVRQVLRFWMFWGLVCFFVFVQPFLTVDAYHFYVAPIFLLGCFLFEVPLLWRVVIGAFLFSMCVLDISARSQIIKASVVLLCAIVYLFRGFIKEIIMRVMHAVFYVAAIVLLVLGITNRFNILEYFSNDYEGRYLEWRMEDGVWVEEDISSDTRTFIYEEVILSAVSNGYILFGRTPARGNDSVTFGSFTAENLKTGLYERHGNEMAHTNVFTWLGLIGLVLYGLFYFYSSWLAVYRSNSFALKLLGVFIAFRWMFGWIEDFNSFDIANAGLWMIIAICMSSAFRNMTDKEFKQWLCSCLPLNINAANN